MTPEALARFRSGQAVIGVGLMSGTSADGVDAVVARLTAADDRPRVEQLAFVTTPHPAVLRDRLDRAFRDAATVSEISALHYEIAHAFAAAAAVALAMTDARPDFVASHGQTVWHDPRGERGVRSTLQLGQPAVLAARLGCVVVSDFRAADLVAGGEGAPLVPLADWLLFADATRNRAVQNLGGIANVTYLAAGCSREDVIAFDTGPANALIDEAARRATAGRQRFDQDGRLAASGQVDAGGLAALLALPQVDAYLRRPPPKSTGRELFRADLVDRVEAMGVRGADLVATLTQLTVETIVRAYRDFLGPLDEAILGGGGAHNPELRRRLAEALPGVALRTHDELGIDGDAKEALAFALLGYETLRGRAGNVPSATGAAGPVVLGSITPPPPPE